MRKKEFFFFFFFYFLKRGIVDIELDKDVLLVFTLSSFESSPACLGCKQSNIMVKIHTRALRKQKKVLNDISHIKIQKNVDLLLYLNYLRFLNALLKKADLLSTQDASSEILTKHLLKSKGEILKRFRG